jgi:Fe-S cluster biogenesis protein NfuA
VGSEASLTMTPEEAEAVIRATVDELRPAVQFDGGDVTFVDFSPATGVVRVEMAGACVGCSMSSVTLQAGIERILKERCPLVTSVINVGA